MNAALKRVRRLHEAEVERWRAAWEAWEAALWQQLPDTVLMILSVPTVPEDEGDAAFGRVWAGAFGVEDVEACAGDDARLTAAEAFVEWYKAVQEHVVPGRAVAEGEEPALDLACWPSTIPPPPEEPPGAWAYLTARLPRLTADEEVEACTVEDFAVANGLFVLAFARAVRRAANPGPFST